MVQTIRIQKSLMVTQLLTKVGKGHNYLQDDSTRTMFDFETLNQVLRDEETENAECLVQKEIQEYQRVKQQRRIFRHVSKYRKFERVLKNSATEICGGLVRVSRKICSKAEPRFVQHRRTVQSITLTSKNETARKASHSSQNSSRRNNTLEPRKLFNAHRR